GPGNAAKIARNSFNLAMGGIRLSQIEVPTAMNVGENTGAGACPRWGYHTPFDVATLDALYPTRERYVDEVTRVTRENLRRGFILQPDAQATIREAAPAGVGRDARARFDSE